MEENLKKKNIKKLILGSFLGILIGSLLGTTYAMFTYERGGSQNSKLITGNIYMRYKEDTTLTLHDAMPSNTYDSNNKFEFTIDGANTTTNKDVWYEIKVKRGEIPELTPTRSEENRIADKFIKYTLVEEKDGVETIVVDGESWEGLTTGKTIWVDKIEKNKPSETHKYTLYMWLSNKIEIGNSATADFTINDWNKAFASIKVDVNGDFTEKTVDEPYQTVNVINIPNPGPTLKFVSEQKANIKEVYFNKMDETTMNTRYNAATIKADLTANNEGKVLAWLEENTDDKTKYNLIIASDGKTYLTMGGGLFEGFSSMTNIYFNNLDTSRLWFAGTMFKDCSSLTTLNLSSFDTSSLQQTPNMFTNCTSLTELDLSSFGSHSLFAPEMFKNCTALETIYVSSLWNTTDTSQGIPIFVNNTALIGKAPNGTTYSFTDYNTEDKTYAVIATNTTPGYLTDVSLKTNN